MKKFNLTIIAAVIAGMSGTALAAKGSGSILDDDMSRRGPLSTSGSGDTVEANCGGAAYQDATAEIEIDQDGSSEVKIEVEDAVPNTYFTVWLRVKGGAGFNDGGSPWTGGGATPLCSGTEFADLNAASPWNSGGTAHGCNGFTTDSNGDGTFKSTVNFPVVGGAYPFQQSGGAEARPGHGIDPVTGIDGHPDVPTAIVDPRTGNGGPFMIRVISHCTDQLNHGLSPATREAWFQYP